MGNWGILEGDRQRKRERGKRGNWNDCTKNRINQNSSISFLAGIVPQGLHSALAAIWMVHTNSSRASFKPQMLH